MIIMIILIVLVLLNAIFFIIGLVNTLANEENEYGAWVAGIGAGFGLIFLAATFICGGICIGMNVAPEAKVVEWEEYTEYLKNKKEMLENIKPIISPEGEVVGLTSDIYLHYDNPQEYYEDVDAYNKAVRAFTVDIKSGIYKRSNPLISWFVSPAYNMFDQSKLEGLSYSIGK